MQPNSIHTHRTYWCRLIYVFAFSATRTFQRNVCNIRFSHNYINMKTPPLILLFIQHNYIFHHNKFGIDKRKKVKQNSNCCLLLSSNWREELLVIKAKTNCKEETNKSPNIFGHILLLIDIERHSRITQDNWKMSDVTINKRKHLLVTIRKSQNKNFNQKLIKTRFKNWMITNTEKHIYRSNIYIFSGECVVLYTPMTRTWTKLTQTRSDTMRRRE